MLVSLCQVMIVVNMKLNKYSETILLILLRDSKEVMALSYIQIQISQIKKCVLEEAISLPTSAMSKVSSLT